MFCDKKCCAVLVTKSQNNRTKSATGENLRDIMEYRKKREKRHKNQ